MKKLIVLLCLVAPIFGGSEETKTDWTWITLGSDAMPAIRAEFNDREWRVFEKRHLTNDAVTLMRVTEPQLIAISRMMHHKFNRCGGFIAHSSYEQAIAAGHRDTLNIANKMAISYNLDMATEVNTVMPDLTEQGIVDVIIDLANHPTRYYTSQSSVDAANWLKSRWDTLANGRSDISVELYSHSWLMPSVVLTITGAWQPQDIIVMGGHLDSINQSGSSAPGADDDASGIATLTEILAAALARGYTPARTIKVMAYAAEEVGLRGSQDLAEDAKANGDNIIGVLQLDMTNYNGSADDIYLMGDYTNSAQNGFITNLIDTYTSHSWNTSSSCGYACSDHASWHNQGFPASMPFEAALSQSNPYIHTANDTISVSGGGAAHAIKFARMGLAYMIEMGKGGLNGDAGSDPGPVGGGGGNQGTELTNPTTLTNLGGASGSEARYYIDVPANASNLQIYTSGGSGDCDLYTRFGSAPTTSSYDCRPYENGNSESCPVANPNEGTYHIMLRGYSSYSGMTLNVSYDSGNNAPPTAGFTHSVNNLTASFTDTSSDSDGNIVSRSWNFGDGASSTSNDPTHTYASSGTYTVTLAVTDNGGLSDSSSASVTVSAGNSAPNASFSHSVNNLTASFTDNSSDSDGSISSRSWDFGDGASSSSTNPTHTYASAGTYSVTLTVTDNGGLSDSTTASVTVTNPPAGPTELVNGQTVTGLSGSTGTWDMFYINLPTGATNLSVAISGGSGDADLYTRFGAEPTTSSWDCRPYQTGNSENCGVASPSAGNTFIGIRAYSSYSNLTLTVSYTEPGSGCTPDGWTETNLSASTGGWVHFSLDVPPCATSLNVDMSVGTGDGDLYVNHGSQPTTSSWDCRPYDSGNTENCSFNNPAEGIWYISIRAYSSFSGVTLEADYQ